MISTTRSFGIQDAEDSDLTVECDITEAQNIVDRDDLEAHVMGESCTSTRPALIVKLTGYRLITIFVVVAIGVAKAILTYGGQFTAPTTLDWVLGIVATLGLWWLGLYEAVQPPVLPWLFHVDYSRIIVKSTPVQLLISASIGYVFWLLVEIPVILSGAPLIMYFARGPGGYLIASGLMGVITLVIWVPVIVAINVLRSKPPITKLKVFLRNRRLWRHVVHTFSAGNARSRLGLLGGFCSASVSLGWCFAKLDLLFHHQEADSIQTESQSARDSIQRDINALQRKLDSFLMDISLSTAAPQSAGSVRYWAWPPPDEPLWKQILDQFMRTLPHAMFGVAMVVLLPRLLGRLLLAISNLRRRKVAVHRKRVL